MFNRLNDRKVYPLDSVLLRSRRRSSMVHFFLCLYLYYVLFDQLYCSWYDEPHCGEQGNDRKDERQKGSQSVQLTISAASYFIYASQISRYLDLEWSPSLG